MILLALTLLFVGVVGLFAGSARADGPKVIEYGDAKPRYVLAEFEPLRPEPVEKRTQLPTRGATRGAGVRRHRTGRRSTEV